MGQIQTETIEGLVGGKVWFHYDVTGDVLYLRASAHRNSPAVGEETDDGLLSLRHEVTDEPVGLTVVNWWKRFGRGQFPDSIKELESRIEPWARRVAA